MLGRALGKLDLQGVTEAKIQIDQTLSPGCGVVRYHRNLHVWL